MNHHGLSFLSIAFLLCSATYGRAGISITTGYVVEVIQAPSSLEPGQEESDSQIIAFDELQDHPLADDLEVDILYAGVYQDPHDLTPGVIDAGTVVEDRTQPVSTVTAGIVSAKLVPAGVPWAQVRGIQRARDSAASAAKSC